MEPWINRGTTWLKNRKIWEDNGEVITPLFRGSLPERKILKIYLPMQDFKWQSM
jgi:hypothetical protein